ncbi:MAG: FAD-dependent oxidoreductase [Candidatus Latescibacteria bacterium]|nr:FAD-dependent oxidoreductase [Candidatus Latescibacterota bacterium]NIM21467.1 FAD-dependent oxidoreductase [Candidatus Latescibacterota bacterium]NIM65638.1 FAD-dependent oxidoreductase [Candidatus Latescibacterota bacterium]NIO02020.1 FAD-dependent oxidoreductase [Candidatus Latescibacterota bacterium]NIO28832.1 FAD-dependent oxidoreductase [Candidatus Latescibacterota bacterium]
MRQTYDAVIIGAGIMGCSSALQLARRGLKIALVEKGAIGEGPTGRSSAIIRQHYSNELTARMALYGLRVFEDFEEQVGGDCGFRRTGFVLVVDAKDREGLQANLALQHRIGIQAELVAPEALREIMPGLAFTDLVAAAYEPDSGYADPHLTVTSYERAARRLGVTVFPGTEAKGVRFEGGRVIGVETSRNELDTPVVLNCAGAWGAQVARMAGVEVPINACRVQVAFFKRPADHEGSHPVVADFVNATYFRSETGDLTLAGLVDPSEADAVVDPDNYIERVDFDFVSDLGERLVRRYPGLERSESRGGFASLYAITPDWHPIVDEVPPDSGFYICSGFSGHGFKLGPAVGVMAADMITGKSEPEFDPHIFRASRYAERDEIRGQYEYSIAG